MRVIKLYEDFTENINDIVKKRVSFIKKFKSDVEDCFVELLDDHFLVDVNVTNNNNRNSGYFRCDISIYKDVERDNSPESFDFIDIKEYIMMFESYINEYDYDLLKYDLPGVVKDLDSVKFHAISGFKPYICGNYVKIGVWIKL
jgi:hypothetical protein